MRKKNVSKIHKHKTLNKNEFKSLLFGHLFMLLTLSPVNHLSIIRKELEMFSGQNEIILKVKGTGKFPVLWPTYFFIPSSYYLNDDLEPREYNETTIYFPNEENIIRLIFTEVVGNCTTMFRGCNNILEIDLSNFISPNKASLDLMFQDCTSLKSINFGNFQTSNMNNMNQVFYHCTSLESLDLSSFVTSKVTHFHWMFYACNKLQYLDLSNFRGDAAQCIHNMFNGCTNLVSINLSNFHFPKVTLIQNMFLNCSNLISLDLYSFEVHSAIGDVNKQNVFSGCKNLEHVNFKKAVIASNNLNIYENMIANSQKDIVFCIDESNADSNQKNCEFKIEDCSDWGQNNKKMVSDYDVCVENCTVTSFAYEYSGQCYNDCPYDSIKVGFMCYDCIELDVCGETTPEVFKNQIRKKLTSYLNSNIIKGSNFLALVSSSDKINPEEQLKQGISAYDLGNCTNDLKKHYNIPDEENLIILNMEFINQNNESDSNDNTKSFDLGKTTQLEIYDYSGNKLNLSICEENIKIFKYLGDVEEIDIKTAQDYSSQGINVFDAKDNFFNDLCHNYINSEGKDIVLTDRRIDIYQNITFCQFGCIYLGVNYDLMAANCLCGSIFLQEEEGNITKTFDATEDKSFKDLAEVLKLNLFDFNFEIIRCYNLVSDMKILIHNIGFYSLFTMFFLQIIFFIVYLVQKLTSIKKFIIKMNHMNKKNNNTNQNKQKVIKNLTIYNNKKQKAKSKFKPNPPIKRKNKNMLVLNSPGNNNRRNKISDNLNSKSKKRNVISNQGPSSYSKENLNKEKNSKIDIKRRINKQLDIKSNQKILRKNNPLNLFNKNDEDSVKLFETIYNMQDMNYEEAIIYDKRGYFKMYWGFLVDTQIILGTFCTDNHLDLFIIKLSFLVCTFQISFFLNAFFYTDEYISDAYHNDGILDFVSGLPKSIYSYVATLITTNLLRMLSNIKNDLVRLIREKQKYKTYLYLINLKLGKLKKKLIIYFILVFLFTLFSMYYVVAFCAVYKNSQKYWFLGCLESFGMDSAVSFGICIFLALLRYISVKKHIKCCYIFSNIVSTFL